MYFGLNRDIIPDSKHEAYEVILGLTNQINFL